MQQYHTVNERRTNHAGIWSTAMGSAVIKATPNDLKVYPTTMFC